MKQDRLDEQGREILDPNPMEVPVGFDRPETLQETIQRIMRTSEAVAEARRLSFETAEEADDFDIPEDETFDPETPFEQVYDPVLDREVTAAELLANPALYQRLYAEAAKEGVDPSSEPGSKEAGDSPAEPGEKPGSPTAAERVDDTRSPDAQ